jgi:diaminohydroxyphosphoribosylaminopyrimidine deaminase/5-amino-6-(5-phosphoribosylamino)uracil reductase
MFVRARLVDEVAVFVAPVLVGGDGVPLLAGAGAGSMAEALRLERIEVRRFGDDVLLRGRPKY